MRSRISQNIEKKNQTTLILSIVGILIIIIIFLKFGINALINFSLFLNSSKNTAILNSANSSQNNAILETPTFNVSQVSTNSANIQISGSGPNNTEVILYRDNNKIDQTITDNNGNFNFKNESLDKGTNNFTTQAINGKSKSSFSDPEVITYTNTAPNLSITAPSDGATFSHDQNPIQITGKTDPNVNVTVNGFFAQTDLNGNYSYTLNLNNGSNQVTVDAVDQAGNKTEKIIHVNYNQ